MAARLLQGGRESLAQFDDSLARGNSVGRSGEIKPQRLLFSQAVRDGRQFAAANLIAVGTL